jgi:hypothetical protein
MNKLAVLVVLLFGSLAFAQDANSNNPQPNQGKDSKQQKAKGPHADPSAYHSPYESDISKSSYGASKGTFTQGSVTNASPQHAAGAQAPTIDFHQKHAPHSEPKAAAKAKPTYDPGQYKSKAPAKPPL